MMEAMPAEAHMSARNARRLYDLLESAGIDVWIDGGWAVDALLAEPTRPHADLDIALETRHVDRVREVLSARGFLEVPRDDSTAWNFVLDDGAGLQVDVHAFTFDERGDGVYGPSENGDAYPAEALTGMGIIDGRRVRCISAAWLVRFHTGYPWTEKDERDVAALCERFGLAWPDPAR
jgi:lincosamide nucleotidyltransferase A/C/D/E